MMIKLGLRIQDDLERKRFASLFSSIPARLTTHWVVTDDLTEANVVVIDTSEPGSQYFYQSCKTAVTAVPLVYGDSNVLNSEWFITKPVRAGSLIEILNLIGDCYVFAGHVAKRRGDPPLVVGRKNLRNLPSLIIKQFENNLGNPGFGMWLAEDFGAIVKSPGEQIAVPDGLVQIRGQYKAISSSVGRLRQMPLDVVAMIREDKRYIGISLAEFRWMCYLMFSQGQLREDLDRLIPYQLTEPPHLATLPHSPVHVHLCQSWLKGPASLDELIERAGLPESQIIGFFNACQCMGLLQPVRPSSQGFLSRHRWAFFP